MDYRSPTVSDIHYVLELHGCSKTVMIKAARSIATVEMFVEAKTFGRVAVIFKREYQFFENHVLRDELLFIDFFNGLLDRLQIRTHKPVEGFAVLDMSV
ncbi:DUF3388 domain-containing protein [Caenorhabditis elegans]|uniref:DUF3388 domain-containing protein n=1 Tax=Caenorhabditis elegans TaxID=6239 RepID=Q9XXK3_CAEEL|nr:DUF3388 domain-containing protein [Caenorhabditis elegans]CAA19426.1 DUF3388 domain-containing protein [Caenorhabditis elegans]|eukprot:NP_510577.1 Uncharacterized protein CELE_H08J19.1 [Caenorhabditis elegans]